MYLNHHIYEELKELIGAEQTLKLASRYGGEAVYFPRIDKEGHARGVTLKGGVRHAEVRSFICRMRREGATGVEICEAIKKQWPGQPERWVTKSSLSRFLIKVRSGRMRDFGINDSFGAIDGAGE